MATSTWPADMYWARLAEEYKYQFENKTLNYAGYINSQINGTSSATDDQLYDHIKNNLLKVSSHISYFAKGCVWGYIG